MFSCETPYIIVDSVCLWLKSQGVLHNKFSLLPCQPDDAFYT